MFNGIENNAENRKNKEETDNYIQFVIKVLVFKRYFVKPIFFMSIFHGYFNTTFAKAMLQKDIQVVNDKKRDCRVPAGAPNEKCLQTKNKGMLPEKTMGVVNYKNSDFQS